MKCVLHARGKITENPDIIYIVKEAELFRSEYCETTYFWNSLKLITIRCIFSVFFIYPFLSPVHSHISTSGPLDLANILKINVAD